MKNFKSPLLQIFGDLAPSQREGGEVEGFPLWTYGFDIVLANSRARESEIGDGERDL